MIKISCIFGLVITILFTACEKFEKLISVKTGISSDVKLNTAIVSGEIVDIGNGISAYGHCWSKTNTQPTLENCDSSTTINEDWLGTFQSNLKGLSAETNYFIRAYATGKEGAIYGEVINLKTIPATITDMSGYTYNVLQIGNQIWTKENLKTTKYSNGDLIQTTNPVTLSITTEASPKYQWAYSGDEVLISNYGRLYTWYAAADNRNICPSGWHVASDADWTELTTYLEDNGFGYGGSGNDVAMALASKDWLQNTTIPGNVAHEPANNNSTGFSARAGGFRFNSGTFNNLSFRSYWWSSSKENATMAWFRVMSYDGAILLRNTMDKNFGYSIRCIKD